MDCGKRFGIISVLAWGLFIGCNKSGTTSTPSADGSGKTVASAAPATNETDPSSSPIAKAAYDFVDAVVKGDTQRASARLTPQAMQQIVASGKQFAPPGFSAASFKIGGVREPAEGRAIVQFIIAVPGTDAPQNEEMCCLLRKVDNDWRVSGIADPSTLIDFESGKSQTLTQPQMSGGMANAPNAGQSPSQAAMQPGSGQQPATPSQPAAGMPPVATQYNAPAVGPGPNGLGMPAVAAPAANASPYQTQAPYTAREPATTDRR